MSQQYPPNKATSNQASKTGVTAVLDSLIRDIDERERKTEGPLVKRRSPSPLLSETEVLDLSMTQAAAKRRHGCGLEASPCRDQRRSVCGGP